MDVREVELARVVVGEVLPARGRGEVELGRVEVDARRAVGAGLGARAGEAQELAVDAVRGVLPDVVRRVAVVDERGDVRVVDARVRGRRRVRRAVRGLVDLVGVGRRRGVAVGRGGEDVDDEEERRLDGARVRVEREEPVWRSNLSM